MMKLCDAKGVVMRHAGFFRMRYCLAICILAAVVAGCDRASDETRIHSALDAIIEAITQKDSRGVVAHLSPVFRDRDDRDAQAMRRLMAAHFLRNERIGITVTRREIVVIGEAATVRMQVVLSGSSGLFPERGGYYLTTQDWRKEDGEWRLLRLDWERVLSD